MSNVPSLSTPGRLKNLVFGLYFFALLMMALFPPFYLKVSGSAVLVLGIPLPIFYWILIAVLMGLGLWGPQDVISFYEPPCEYGFYL